MTSVDKLHLVTGLVMGALALGVHLGTRRLRPLLTRKSMPVFLVQFGLFTMFVAVFFKGVMAILVFAGISAIYLPVLFWASRTPGGGPSAS